MRLTSKIIFSFFLLLWVASCTSPKKILYLQDSGAYSEGEITADYEMRFQPGDVIGITVNSKFPELALPFNLPIVASRAGAGESTAITGQYALQGYLVDEKGCIQFPELGEIPVKGKTREMLRKQIVSELAERDLVQDAVVTITFQNFKITVLGEVVRPGSFQISSEKVSIFDAIGMAGDLTIYGKRDRVMLIRQGNGKYETYAFDLRSKDIFQSPNFYLKQSDVIYVEPNRAKSGQSDINQNTAIGTWVSVLSLLTTVMVVLFK